MNPAGYRLEEKKEQSVSGAGGGDTKSTHSYKSTHSTRSSVLERAREYNRRIEETRRRAKSLERTSSAGDNDDAATAASSTTAPRSKSVGRSPQTTSSSPTPRLTTRERAMASVRRESSTSRGGSQPPETPRRQAQSQPPPVNNNTTTTPTGGGTPTSGTPRGGGGGTMARSASPGPRKQQQQQTQQQSRAKPSPGRLMRNSQGQGGGQQQQQQQPQQEGEGVVSPELLVDALSGHEDGLLAIAEKLMEHYDGGYDVMGEAIIDAFADVQKLFQHVVEAAHMEGAAFEASRREEEMAELRRQAAAGELNPELLEPNTPRGGANNNNNNGGEAQSPNGPIRHDEFVDQDVKDTLTEAIRKGAALRDANQHAECFKLYETACQSASALLPVDSDHRGRLQLSIARSESMNPDRACAILRYAMDDVLRSAMRAGRTPLPDPSKRADVVLSRPAIGQTHSVGVVQPGGVIQSSDEALASTIEEMKEIISAPVYKDTPLQEVAQRFWVALTEAQKNQQKHSERLEQSLGKLKGEFLLARAEWEEKLSSTSEVAETYKEKYERLKDTRKGEDYLDQARSSAANQMHHHHHSTDASFRSGGSSQQRPASVASLGSGLAIHAKKLVNSINDFNCNALNERAQGAVSMDTAELDQHDLHFHSNGGGSRGSPVSRSSPRSRSSSSRQHRNKVPGSGNASRYTNSKDQYSRSSPQRMDL